MDVPDIHDIEEPGSRGTTPGPTAVGSRPRLVRALIWSSGGDAVSKLAVLATTVVAARSLDPIRFGLFIGLSALLVLSSAVWDAGSSVVVTREVAARRISPRQATIETFALRAKTLVPWLIVFALGLIVLRPGSLPTAAVLAFAVASLLGGARALPVALLQARLRFAAVGIAMSVGRWVTAGTALAVFEVHSGARLTVLGLAAAVGEATTIAIAALLILGTASEPGGGTGRVTLRTATPFAVNTILGLAYNRLDVLVVAALTSATQLAAYAPASRLQDALYLLPTALGAVVLPLAATAWREGGGASEVDRLVRRLIFGGVALALPIAAFTCVFASQIITGVLGPGYDEAIVPARVLVWFLPLSAISAPPLAGLAAIGRGRDTVMVFGATFVAAIGALVLLVPWFGAVGGAIGSLFRDLVGVTVTVALARRAGLLRRRSNSVASTTEHSIANDG